MFLNKNQKFILSFLTSKSFEKINPLGKIFAEIL